MSFDLYASYRVQDKDQVRALAENKGDYSCFRKAPWTMKAQIMRTGFIVNEDLKKIIQTGKDGKTPWSAYPEVANQEVEERQEFNRLKRIFLPESSEKVLQGLPTGSCLIQITLRLTRPFHSRDDRDFYPLDNPVKRDWVFQIPYLGASGIKGLLRWGWQMQFSNDKQDREMQIFGPPSGSLNETNARQGCLYTWPLFWDPKVGLEVINPQDRQTGAGTDPVRYEVVESGSLGTLFLLLMNRNMEQDFLFNILPDFLQCLQVFLDGGVSAKRSADWGSVESTSWKAWIKSSQSEQTEHETADASSQDEDPREGAWAQVIENGRLKDFSDPVYSKKILALLTGRSEKNVTGKHKEKTLKKLEELFHERCAKQASQAELQEEAASKSPQAQGYIERIEGNNFDQWKSKLLHKIQEGI